MTVPNRHRWRAILSALAAFLVLGVVARWLYGGTFDAAAWRDPGAVKRGDRLRMVNDLGVRYLPGLTREQVIDLLGRSADPTSGRPDTRLYPAWDLVYPLAVVDVPFVIGPGNLEVLVIRFGPGGRVTEYQVGHEWRFR